MNREERKFLRRQVKLIPQKGVIVEIGSWKGGSSVELAKANKKYEKKASLYCIDTWDYREGYNHPELCKLAKGEDIYEAFKNNMRDYSCTVLKGLSEMFLKQFENESVDLIFLDADHSYEAVKQDISNWWLKLRHDGIFCGHDYGRTEYGVTEAVNEFWDNVENPARSMWKVVK